MDEVSVSQTDQDEQPQGWDQEEMGRDLVEEAIGDSPVEFLPIGDRVLVYPVVPDEQRPVDIHIVKTGGQDLPDMGVVCAVGYQVNQAILEQMELQEDPDMRFLLEHAEFIARGDIVAVNKFSGMDVPGTSFVLLSRLDVLGKVLNFPVRLRKQQDRWDQIEAKGAETLAERARPEILTPSHTVITGRR